MNPIDLKACSGDRYRVDCDGAGAHEPSGKSNPWLYLLPCRYGQISPSSGELLAVYCDRKGVLTRLGRIDGLIPHQIDDEETVDLFKLERFDAVAAVVHSRRKRRMSAEGKAALIERGREHRFVAQDHGVQAQ